MARARWAVLCDFDGTATVEDVGDQVSRHFAGEGVWRAAEDDFAAGAFSFGELLRRIFAPITASAEEIGAFARQRAVFRPGFVEALARCQERDVPFVIVSAGLDVYIHAVLAQLPPALRAHVAVRSNHARCSPSGLQVEFHAPGGGCGQCGFCKRVAVDDARAQGRRVAFVGDGTGDRCAAEAADLLFARRSLARWCDGSGLRYHAFETFDEVMDRLAVEGL